MGHDLSEKAQNDQTLRLLLAQPSAQKIEERLGIELADRRTVRALHVVGFDFEVREGVGSTLVRKQQIPVGLVRVGPLSAAMYPNDPPERRLGAVIERAL